MARGIDAQRVLPALLVVRVGCAMAAPAGGASVQNTCKYAYDNHDRARTAGRTLMKSRRSLRARVALKPGRGATVTRVVTLRR